MASPARVSCLGQEESVQSARVAARTDTVRIAVKIAARIAGRDPVRIAGRDPARDSRSAAGVETDTVEVRTCAGPGGGHMQHVWKVGPLQ